MKISKVKLVEQLCEFTCSNYCRDHHSHLQMFKIDLSYLA